MYLKNIVKSYIKSGPLIWGTPGVPLRYPGGTSAAAVMLRTASRPAATSVLQSCAALPVTSAWERLRPAAGQPSGTDGQADSETSSHLVKPADKMGSCVILLSFCWKFAPVRSFSVAKVSIHDLERALASQLRGYRLGGHVTAACPLQAAVTDSGIEEPLKLIGKLRGTPWFHIWFQNILQIHQFISKATNISVRECFYSSKVFALSSLPALRLLLCCSAALLLLIRVAAIANVCRCSQQGRKALLSHGGCH